MNYIRHISTKCRQGGKGVQKSDNLQTSLKYGPKVKSGGEREREVHDDRTERSLYRRVLLGTG